MRADVVIIGGGVIGSSVAYHLAAAQERSVIVIERDASYSQCILGPICEFHPAAVHDAGVHPDVAIFLSLPQAYCASTSISVRERSISR